MKAVVFLSLVFTITIALAIVIAVLNSRGDVDKPTPATTRDGALQAFTLPDNLPVMFESANPEADATQIYKDMIEYYKRNRYELDKDVPEAEVIIKLIDQLIAGMNCGRVQDRFLDQGISLKMGSDYDQAEWVKNIGLAGLTFAESLEDKKRAREVCRAVWAFGQRVFENSDLYKIRTYGRAQWISAGQSMVKNGMLNENAPAENEYWDKINLWGEAEGTYAMLDERIYKVIRTGGTPNVGDLVNIALYHGDPAYRVLAIQRLSEEKFDPRTKANEKLIIKTLEQLQGEKSSLISDAAKAAIELTVQEMHDAKW